MNDLPDEIPAGAPITFNANDSYEEEGPIKAYFWNFGDLTYSEEAEVVHSYMIPGEYEIILEVVDTNNAWTTVKKIIKVNSTASLTEQEFNYRVYPNPAVSIVHFELPTNFNNYDIQFMGLSGKETVYLKNKSGSFEVDMESFQPGVYIYQIKSGNQVLANSKIILFH